MIATIIFVICIFLTIWSTILFVGALRNHAGFPVLNILIYTLAVTGIVTHLIGIW